YTFLTTAADAGAQYQCIVSIPASYNSSLTATSSIGTLTLIPGALSYTNGLKVERFLGALRSDVENHNTGAANDISLTLASGLEVPANDNINNYGRRASGWLIPPADGVYDFFLSSDDDADLFLSNDETAAGKQLIAQENNWSDSRSWTNS